MKLLMIGMASAADAPGAYTIRVLMKSSQNSATRVRCDDEIFRLIFVQHNRFIIRFLYGMVGERSLAEELTQETFMRAHRSIGTLRCEAKLSTWLCGIAKNVALNALRARRREPPTIEFDEQLVATPGGGNATRPDDKYGPRRWVKPGSVAVYAVSAWSLCQATSALHSLNKPKRVAQNLY